MARSRRHKPIIGITTCTSEKQDKRKANRALRAAMRGAVARGDDVLPEMDNVSDIWGFSKDGKRWHSDVDAKLMRK